MPENTNHDGPFLATVDSSYKQEEENTHQVDASGHVGSLRTDKEHFCKSEVKKKTTQATRRS